MGESSEKRQVEDGNFKLAMRKTVCYVMFAFAFSGFGQSERIEKALMTCILDTMPDKGKSLSILIEKHQALLFEEALITDTTAQALETAIKKVASGNLIEMPSKLFSKQLNALHGPKKEEFNKCQVQLAERADEKETDFVTTVYPLIFIE